MSSNAPNPERILVVDDEDGIRTALQRTIARTGHESFLAADGADGLAQAAKIRPAVIILDLRMPKMDGHTFLRRLANLDLDSAVIVSSADGEMDDVIEVMRHGAVDYMRKPWSPAEVVSAIARAIETRERRLRPRTSDAIAAPPAAAMQQILERIQRGEILLPSVPTIVHELRELVVDREASIDDLVKLVERDQALSARVLQLGRTAHYAHGKQMDLSGTIARLGMQTLHSLVETVWLNGCFLPKDPRYAELCQRIARFGLARALAARSLATPAKLTGTTGYFSGLFADAGAAFLLHVVVEKHETPPPPEACLELVRDHHEEIGAQLLKQWGHSDEVVRRARHHHSAPATRGRSEPSALLCAVASSIAAEITGDTDLTGAMPSREQADACARALGIDDETRSKCVAMAATELGAVLQVL